MQSTRKASILEFLRQPNDDHYLSLFYLQMATQRTVKISRIAWYPLKDGFCKINTYDDSKGNPGNNSRWWELLEVSKVSMPELSPSPTVKSNMWEECCATMERLQIA